MASIESNDVVLEYEYMLEADAMLQRFAGDRRICDSQSSFCGLTTAASRRESAVDRSLGRAVKALDRIEIQMAGNNQSNLRALRQR